MLLEQFSSKKRSLYVLKTSAKVIYFFDYSKKKVVFFMQICCKTCFLANNYALRDYTSALHNASATNPILHPSSSFYPSFSFYKGNELCGYCAVIVRLLCGASSNFVGRGRRKEKAKKGRGRRKRKEKKGKGEERKRKKERRR